MVAIYSPARNVSESPLLPPHKLLPYEIANVITEKKKGYFNFVVVVVLLFYFIFKLYNIVLVSPNIKMNPPQVYMCSPS